jgi:hypothetical protein
VIKIEDPDAATAKTAEHTTAGPTETPPPPTGEDAKKVTIATPNAELGKGFAEEPTQPAIDLRKELAELEKKS